MPQHVAPDLKSQAAWFAALGSPVRLALIRALVPGPKTVGALAEASDVRLWNLANHLNCLRAVGLVIVERKGSFAHCSLAGATAVDGGVELVHPSGPKVFVPLT